ncbi:MAG: CBS domain-containing protein [Betaproteobacteria bacterium]|nr:MAG: CBS domain-containing protein [Betaproteobacteria bacterium]TMH46923.1 MAG: CBS domain-containing protein [Betaproteobacteria bacterium]
MRVSDAMTREVRVASPGQSIREVAKIMAEIDAGAMPVGDNDRLVGMITDRDIAIRAVAEGKGPDTPVREVMSTETVLYCYEDEELDHVAKNMSEQQVRRLPVVNRDKRLVGIVSLGNLAQTEGRAANKAVKGVTKPSGQHNQSPGTRA